MKDLTLDQIITINKVHQKQMARIWEMMGNDPMDELADIMQDAPDEMDEAHKEMEREALLAE